MEYIKMQYVMINAEVHHAMTLMGTVLSSNRVDKPTLFLDNLDTDDYTVLVTISGEGAADFANMDQTIMGSNWETDGDDLAYAIIDDHPALIKILEKEGYSLNTDEYCPVD